MSSEVSMDLIEFLEARLTEDEQRATAALGLLGYANEWWTVDELRKFPRGDGHAFTLADAGFVAAHTPKRVLREVAAKRAIVKMFSVPDPHEVSEECNDCNALYALALVYSGHPDYCAEWED